MPRLSKLSLASTKRNLERAKQNKEISALTGAETLNFTSEGSDSEDQSLPSSDEEDFTCFYSKFTAALSDWVQAEARFRAAYTGSSRWSTYRKRQRDHDRAHSMKNSPNLLHYFKVDSTKEPEEPIQVEADYTSKCEKAEIDAKKCLSQNTYTNVFCREENLTSAQKAILEALHLILCWLRIGKPELQARNEVCQMFGWSQYKARNLKFWLQQWIETRDLPTSLRGKHTKFKSLLNDEDVQEDIKLYLRQHPRKVSSLFLKTYLTHEYFPLKFGPNSNKSVSKETCRNWLIKLGFSCATHSKSVYVDGHERKDVVEYRTKFLDEMGELEQLLIKVDDENPEGRNIMPQLTDDQRPHIIVTHDECIFRAHDGKKAFWTEVSRPVIMPKGPGRGIMVSDFLTAIDGRLELPDNIWNSLPSSSKIEDSENVTEVPERKLCRRACQYLEYGKQAQGFWGGNDVVTQARNIRICQCIVAW